MTDAQIYDTPSNFDAVLAAASERARHDRSFAMALRDMTVYGGRFAHGVLATIGLDRLGSDYAAGIDHVARLADELPDPPATDADAVDQFFGATAQSPARQAAVARLNSERQRLHRITQLVRAISQAGETPDYDGAPA